MGYSLLAKLFYGFPLYETDRENNEYNEELAEILESWTIRELEEQGTVAPNNYAYESDEWKEYWYKRSEILSKSKVLNLNFGWSDFVYEAIAIKDSIIISTNGNCEAIVIPPIDPSWDKTLQDWCTKYGFKHREPSWQLGALYW